ncbi:hypothetical protein EYF80_033643 [Liparis tanakae]|uniref:Uncharacterized protein n=1 Tax=Liparis tanakae TaxID=230148 RepID=A0A4Z2GR75_9TELE|nr:hypothetical protein EYF80_033643 [Liparis tanakae]
MDEFLQLILVVPSRGPAQVVFDGILASRRAFGFLLGVSEAVCRAFLFKRAEGLVSAVKARLRAALVAPARRVGDGRYASARNGRFLLRGLPVDRVQPLPQLVPLLNFFGRLSVRQKKLFLWSVAWERFLRAQLSRHGRAGVEGSKLFVVGLHQEDGLLNQISTSTARDDTPYNWNMRATKV